MLDGPSNGTPKHQSLYLKSSTISVAILNGTNLEPKEDNSTVFCLLEYKIPWVLLKYIKITECDSLFKILPE